jgi:peptide/nickel transport system permease protein
VDREFTVQARSQRQQIVRRFVHNKVGMSGLVIFGLLVLFGLVGPLVYRVPYAQQNVNAQSVPPGTAGYPLGSDEIGRDLLAGLMQGVARSLLIVLLFVVIALPLGLLIGALSGYFGRWVDGVLMRVVDLILTVPLLVVLLVVASNFPGARTPLGVGIILGVFGWMDLSRIVRGQFLSLREKEYVEAAHALGASDGRIVFKHLIPNALGSLIVWTTLAAATAIILEASLTYLGFGVNGAGQTSLGRLVSDGAQAASTRPWLFYFPGITLLLIVLSINLIGDGIRDAFDPSNRRVRA